MRVLAIDFGTSNTVAMLRTADGRMRPLLFDGSPLLPSAVYLNPDGRMSVGRDAERSARTDPSRFEPNPKRCVDDGQIILGDTELPVPRVFSQVLTQVAVEARRQLSGAAPEEVRLTHPARWGERRRAVLTEAARLAGLGSPRLIAEPVGAASYFTAVLGSAVPNGRSLAIYDLGGGTFDATVVRRTPNGFDVLAEEGIANVGGLDFDHAIVEHLGKTYAASHAESWTKLSNPTDANDRRHRRLLYEDVRAAKEMLSRTTSTDIHLPALEVDAHLTREELETMVRPYLEDTVECLKRTIEAAKLTPSDLVGIFLVGGSSRIPLAAHLIHTALGVAPTTLEQPETVVVEGALCIGVARPAGAAGQAGHSGVPRTFAPPLRAPARPGIVAPAPLGRPALRPTGPMVPPRPPAGQPVGPRPPAPQPVPPRPAVAPAPPRPLNPQAPGGPPARPVSGVPTSSPPGPAVRPGPQPPQLLRPPLVQRPVQPPLPMNRVPVRPQLPFRPQPGKRIEPTVVLTIVVLVAVVVAFAVLLIIGLS